MSNEAFIRRMAVGMAILGLSIALLATCANACEPRVKTESVCLLTPAVRDGKGEVRVPLPPEGRQIVHVTLPQEIYDHFFTRESMRSHLFRLEVNDRPWVWVRALRGEPLEER